MKRASLAALFIAVNASSTMAQMNVASMTKANGLAEIIYKADQCGYSIDQNKLDRYFSTNHLDTPGALAWITMAIEAAEFDGQPSASACTMAAATARKIGILEE